MEYEMMVSWPSFPPFSVRWQQTPLHPSITLKRPNSDTEYFCPAKQCYPLNVWLLFHYRVCNIDKTDFCLQKMHTHQASLSTTFPDHEVSNGENVIRSVPQISQEHDHKDTEWGHSTSPERIFFKSLWQFTKDKERTVLTPTLQIAFCPR